MEKVARPCPNSSDLWRLGFLTSGQLTLLGRRARPLPLAPHRAKLALLGTAFGPPICEVTAPKGSVTSVVLRSESWFWDVNLRTTEIADILTIEHNLRDLPLGSHAALFLMLNSFPQLILEEAKGNMQTITWIDQQLLHRLIFVWPLLDPMTTKLQIDRIL